MLLNKGKTLGIFQKRTTEENRIGETVSTWTDIASRNGWLDYSAGESQYRTYDSKIQDSTHIFICDYFPLNLSSRDGRMLIEGKTYDILLVDNPMEMDRQLEIYLRYVEGT